MSNKTHKLRHNKNDRCLFVQLQGGLGNQLFIYATSLIIKNKFNIPICVYDNYGKPHSDIDYAKDIFKYIKIIDPDKYKSRIKSAKDILTDLKVPYGEWSTKMVKLSDGDNALGGKDGFTFQNYKSIQTAVPIIRKVMSNYFKKYIRNSNNVSVENVSGLINLKPDDYYRIRVLNNSAFMHIRRGDYAIYHTILPDSYYQNALKELNRDLNIKHVYIFSNDIKWCEETEWLKNDKYIIMRCDDEVNTLYLMSQCTEGAIISHSTFSLWGVMLGPEKNKNSTIIYPSKFCMNHSADALSLPSRWKCIDI